MGAVGGARAGHRRPEWVPLSGGAAQSAEVVHDYNYAQVLTVDLLGKGYRYAEVPISYRRRAFGRSFVRLVPYLRGRANGAPAATPV